jgi:hypothetical protein
MTKIIKLALTILFFLGIGIRDGITMSEAKPTREKYMRHDILLGKWGSGDGELGYKRSQHWEMVPTVPRNFTLDSKGNIYVVDTVNHRVQKFNPAGKFLMKFGSEDDPNGYFENLRHIAVDKKGNIYVSNWKQKRVLQFTSRGRFIREIPSRFDSPSLYIDPQGNFCLNKYKYDSQGNLLGEVKSTIADSEGNYYQSIRDKDLRKIQKFDIDDQSIYEIDMSQYTRLSLVGVDIRDNLYVYVAKKGPRLPEQYHAILKFDRTGTLVAQLLLDYRITWDCILIKLDTQGNIYTSVGPEPGLWRKYDADGGFVITKYELVK